MDAEIFTESFKQGIKRTTSQRRAPETDGEKKRKKERRSLVWSGRLPTWQVITKASYAHTPSVTRQAIPPTTLSPEPRKKTEQKEVRETFGAVLRLRVSV